MIFLTRLNNIALLISLSIVHSLIMRRWKQGTMTYQVLSGLLFGCVTVIGMMNPLKLMPGIIFDGRSIIISIAGLFGGPITAAVTAGISGAYRVWIGGAGAIMGVSVITESALLGVAYHYLRKRHPNAARPLHLLGFGILVHLVMLTLTSTLPGRASNEVLRMIAIPVITIYPVATLLVCMLFLDQEFRLKAEAKFQEQYAMLKGILEGTTQAIFVKDLQGRYIVINPVIEEIFERPAKDIIGHDDAHFFPPDTAREIMTIDQQILKTGEARLIEEAVPLAGQLRQFLVTKSVLRDACGKTVGLIGVARDVTEHKAMEEQLRHAQKLDSVGRLAGGVAHDFNNMLSVIIGHTNLAMSKIDHMNPLYQDLQEIESAAQRSANLTRQLLAFARKQTVSPRVVDLNDVVSGMQSMLARLIRENIELIWSPGADLWPVMMDPTQIDQILANLVVNARDAIQDAGSITVETCNFMYSDLSGEHNPGMKPGNYVLLKVSDTGQGIDPETMRHLFEPFYTTKDIGRGTGLGLATIYGIAKQNHGYIYVSSESGRGTTVRIYLPRAVSVDAEKPDHAITPKPRGGTETILLVEDEPAILNLGKTILEEYGYTVLAALSPDAAIRLAEQHKSRIQLLITDVVMPGMNGKELSERLRMFMPDLKCLYISGYTSDVIAQQGVLDEDVHFVQKPFTITTLADKIREVLNS